MGTEEKEGKNRKVKNVVLAIAIAALLLGAAVGSASAIDINNCGVTAGVPGGYYVLTGDLSCTADETCIIIGANGVTIDGKGHKITGNRSASDCFISIVPFETTSQTIPAKHSAIVNKYYYENVTIKDLEIKEFCSGIALKGGGVNNNTVTGCSIYDCGVSTGITHGIHMVHTNNCTICRNEIYNIEGTGHAGGCSGGGNGIFLFGEMTPSGRGWYNEFTWNKLHDNDKSGFFMKHMCMYNTISNNNATGNGEYGISPMCKKSDDNTFEHNYVAENSAGGIFMGGNRNIIRYNTVINNSGYGFTGRADGTDDNELYGNMFCGHEIADINIWVECTGNHGDCNTCNTISNYDDDGASGCTFTCSASEGACVGATQCFTCGDTVTESCTFNGDMICPNNALSGLIAGASNIVIDGASYSMTGNRGAGCNKALTGFGNPNERNPAKHAGIAVKKPAAENFENVAIKNLEIKNFCTGIVIGHSDHYETKNITVTGCKIHDNGECSAAGYITHGIHMVYVQSSTISENDIHNNTGTGCGCGEGGHGIFLFGGDDFQGKYNNIISNYLHDNRRAGFWTKMKMNNCTLSHNNITGNGQGGIVFRCKLTQDNVISHNNVSYNKGSAIYIGGPRNNVTCNIAINNTNSTTCTDFTETPDFGVGIMLGRLGATNNRIRNNLFCNNEYADVYTPTGSVTGDSTNNTCNTTIDAVGFAGCTFNCPGKVDLNITDKYEQWFGTVYNVIYTIKNLGHSTAPESTTGISIDGTLNKTDPVGLIGPRVSYIRTVGPFTMTGNEDTILVCADKDNAISETDEGNNCLENVFTGVVMPDLVITEKSEEWISLEDKTYNVTYTVKNIGNANANESTTAIIIDGAEAETDHVELLAPQATHTAEFGPFIMSDETDTIRVCADNESAVEESNEDNNCLQNTFEHPGVPDLVISKKFEEWVVSNETCRNYTVTYTVKNVGTGDAGASTTAITIDGAEVANDSVGALGGGESSTNTLGPFTMTADDSDTIKVCADKDNDVEESNEDNNCTENMFEYSDIGCMADDNTLFRCGNTVTKNCTFNGDMSCPFTDGLTVGANSITIEGNNSVLDGTGCTLDAMSRSGIYNQGYDDITIEDLEVKGFCHGMYFNNVYRNTIEHCDIHHNGNASTTAGLFGITMKYVYNSTIRNNSVHHQIANVDPNPGCEDGGNGMFLYKGCYNNFTYNDVYNNTKGGIFIKMQPMHNNISHNDLWDNGQGGIILRCMMSNYNYIEHNNASNNYGSGMFIGAKENTIRYNRICDNRDGGPYYQDSVGGHGYGINLGRSDGSYDNYLHDNEICGNDYKDIYVVSGVTGNHGVNNTCDTTYNYDDDGSTSCTYSCVQQGVCGNVDGLPGVTTNDGRQIFMYLLYGEEQYPLADLWAADCDGLCDGITTNDGRQIFMNLLYGEEDYPLVCC